MCTTVLICLKASKFPHNQTIWSLTARNMRQTVDGNLDDHINWIENQQRSSVGLSNTNNVLIFKSVVPAQNIEQFIPVPSTYLLYTILSWLCTVPVFWVRDVLIRIRIRIRIRGSVPLDYESCFFRSGGFQEAYKILIFFFPIFYSIFHKQKNVGRAAALYTGLPNLCTRTRPDVNIIPVCFFIKESK